MEIRDYYLHGEGVSVTETPNRSGAFAEGLPDTVLIHYTAGPNLSSAVNTLTNPSSRASAHIVIGRDGEIRQLAPFNIIAWHAGQSQYKERTGFNQYSIGIELDNAGELTRRNGGYYSWFGRRYAKEEVVKAVHRNETVEKYWHAFSERQIALVYDLCILLKETYNIKYILGHEEVSPNRKLDPGPAFPLDKLRDKILNPDRSQNEAESPEIPEEGVVSASSLNIRLQPDVESERAARPLPNGTKVKILEAKDGWYKVQTLLEGWVNGKYIK
ncbi:N-acetylmuramoyl-L-alanine amidase [Cytophagaceae bacterium ABcell3]|nr:N-acetylmuramoyl-L-alanine amidase [Cytophagaceae bacterium ABcell3]